MAIGDYPKEYDPKKHGYYDPAKYYGPADTAFGDVKISELPGWIVRRRKTPAAVIGAISRAFWRWQHKYWQPRKAGAAPLYQTLIGSMIFFYFINYDRTIHHRNYKYH